MRSWINLVFITKLFSEIIHFFQFQIFENLVQISINFYQWHFPLRIKVLVLISWTDKVDTVTEKERKLTFVYIT